MKRGKMLSLRILLLFLAGLGSTVVAQATDLNSWASVRGLVPGRPIVVIGPPGCSNQGRTVRRLCRFHHRQDVKQRTVTVPRALRLSIVRVRPQAARAGGMR